MEGFLIFIGIVILILLIIGIANIKIIPQSKAYVVERLVNIQQPGKQAVLRSKFLLSKELQKLFHLRNRL